MMNIKKWLVYKQLREVRNCLVALLRVVGNYATRIILVTEEHYYDNKLGGIETNEYYRKEIELGFFKDGCEYEPTPYGILRKINSSLNMNEDDIFIDFGSGLGRVICFFAVKKIKKVIGVELNPLLVKLSRENIKKLKCGMAPVEIISTDAVNFNPAGGTVFFMFNPFGKETLYKVLSNIREDVVKNPRRIRIVYYSPAHHDIVNAQSWLTMGKKIHGGNVLIWHNHLHSEKS